jgi:hypothetical protein
MDRNVENLIAALGERAKELNCLYEIEELFSKPDSTVEEICRGIVRAIPPGWQYPDVCRARIVLGQAEFKADDFRETPWIQSANIEVQEELIGRISVCYSEERPTADEGPFLKEERRLINTIADRLERRLLHERLKSVFESQSMKRTDEGWRVVLDLLKRTDPKLVARLTRKMLNHLSWSGVQEADKVLVGYSPSLADDAEPSADENRPASSAIRRDLAHMADTVFKMASDNLDEKEIFDRMQKWIREDRSGFLVKIVENPASSLPEVAHALDRFHNMTPDGTELSPPREKEIRVSLINRLLSDQQGYISVGNRHIELRDFYELFRKAIFPQGSHGKLGGKGAGLFLAGCIVRNMAATNPLLRSIKTPKTWYLSSDTILNFIEYNDLEDVVEQKYEDIDQIRAEYPYIMHVFKNSPLPPETVKSLSMALDDFGDTPLIVRSSSLLEDRSGMSFAGKYKSLFIANQGNKRDRLIALADAITEVYASTFGPDPIEYRLERGLIEFHEEMGVMIQEVVGTRIGDFYFPSFAGVAFGRNEYRWSRRLRPSDGMMRVVPGLGTRAVDRLSDDYPVLLSPGQPDLKVNVSLDEQIRYSPKKMDVINLKKNGFDTIEIRELLRKHADDYPMLSRLVSVVEHDRLRQPIGRTLDLEGGYPVFTFNGLSERTGVVEQIAAMLKVLEEETHEPVDIEFAHDGRDLYLLQCRAQSYSKGAQIVPVPRDIPRERIVFSARKYVSTGFVPNISHVVYVDPQHYGDLSSMPDLLAVGKAVGRLNQLLPKRQFVLIGPGRWGSRGDVRLGVSVSYSDINNTAMLIEIARRKKDYVPELSFGTHFFQDLVEASIRYLPLYPDDEGVVFLEEFFTGTTNALPALLPEYERLATVVRVIDVVAGSGGRVLQVYMNGDAEEALGILSDPSGEVVFLQPEKPAAPLRDMRDDSHWRWRLRAAEHVAAGLDARRFGVKAMYVIGSTKNSSAGPESDIDLLVHFAGTEGQRKELSVWFEGWSLSLGYANYLRTGRKVEQLLDIHFVTDDDIRNRTSFAARIGAAIDPARPLTLGAGPKRPGDK